MIHTTIPETDHVYCCPACTWRAVTTTRGLWITEVGDTAVDHAALLVRAQQTSIPFAAAAIARVERLHRAGELSEAQQALLVKAILGEHR